ncbi:hypothetical protein QN404_28490, partial [Pseudomonas sp. RTS1]|uniref:hypothetical protein n=1 Tax=Pseudomonas sp. RTS1 TaxID=3048641 RepID=UPI002B23E51E
ITQRLGCTAVFADRDQVEGREFDVRQSFHQPATPGGMQVRVLALPASTYSNMGIYPSFNGRLGIELLKMKIGPTG